VNISLRFEHFGLKSEGPSLTMTVEPGQTIGIVGKNGSGKSHFLSMISGAEKPSQGRIEVEGDVYHACPGKLSARQKLNTIARPAGTSPASASEALVASGLWDCRQFLPSQISSGQVSAAELLPILSGNAAVALIDRQLDQLDPITQVSVWDRMRHLGKQGMITVVATHNPTVMQRCDALVVLKGEQIRFAGSLAQLRQYVGPAEFVVTTQRQPGVRSIVEPFAVKIEELPDGFKFQAYEGQERAVKLLLEGYGDVSYVISKQGQLIDALARLM